MDAIYVLGYVEVVPLASCSTIPVLEEMPAVTEVEISGAVLMLVTPPLSVVSLSATVPVVMVVTALVVPPIIVVLDVVVSVSSEEVLVSADSADPLVAPVVVVVSISEESEELEVVLGLSDSDESSEEPPTVDTLVTDVLEVATSSELEAVVDSSPVLAVAMEPEVDASATPEVAAFCGSPAVEMELAVVVEAIS